MLQNRDTFQSTEEMAGHDSHEPADHLEKNERLQDTSFDSPQIEHPRELGEIAWASVVISLLFSMFLFSLDNVIVADIQPSIIKTLGHVDKLPWVSVGYALGGTAVNLFVSVTLLSSLTIANR